MTDARAIPRIPEQALYSTAHNKLPVSDSLGLERHVAEMEGIKLGPVPRLRIPPAPVLLSRRTDSVSFTYEGPVQNVFSLGPFGMAPWGSTSNFTDPAAQWIWATAGAAADAETYIEYRFQYIYNNPTGKIIRATVHVIADNVGFVFLNDETVGKTSGGWKSFNYPKFNVTIQPGSNLFEFPSENVGSNLNPAGILVAVKDDESKAVLFRSDASWKTGSFAYESGVQDVFALGRYGMQPWGSQSSFVDPSAVWIWPNSSVGNVTGGGWLTTNYSRFRVIVQPGSNLFVFPSENVGSRLNPAGILVAVLEDESNAILFNSNATWKYTLAMPTAQPTPVPSVPSGLPTNAPTQLP